MNTRIIIFIAVMIVELLSAQSKAPNVLENAVYLFNQDKNELAKVEFQKSIKEGNENWLSYYYLSLMNATEALNNRNDLDKMKSLLEEAQKYQDKANILQPENAEVMIVQAMIHTGWIIYNPMVYGRDLSAVVDYLYNKSNTIAPSNPRVILQKASYNMGKAKYFGQTISPYCEELAKSMELFATFKPESNLHPNWGLEIVKAKLMECKN